MKRLVLGLISIYQKTLSPDTGWLKVFFPGGACRFHPTCSQFTREAVMRYGIIRGLFLGLKRILRCNPFVQGGYDPVPKHKHHD